MNEQSNELTIENSVLLLIDHQPWVAFAVHSIDPGLMINNVARLARAARDLGVPTVLTTVGAQGSILVDPIFKEISEVFPGVTPIDRTSTHAWSHAERPGRHRRDGPQELIMAGLVTEVCLAQSVLAALKDGFDVYFVSDCSGGITKEAHEDAKLRMTQAGAKPMSWLSVLSELDAGLHVGRTSSAHRCHEAAWLVRRGDGRLRARPSHGRSRAATTLSPQLPFSPHASHRPIGRQKQPPTGTA